MRVLISFKVIFKSDPIIIIIIIIIFFFFGGGGWVGILYYEICNLLWLKIKGKRVVVRK